MEDQEKSDSQKYQSRMQVGDVEVAGFIVDDQSRCKHYHSEKDIISIKFKCCNTWYPCYQCHDALSSHSITQWSKDEHDERAILCGNCGSKLTIREYLHCDSECPFCGIDFNTGCEKHHEKYFEV